MKPLLGTGLFFLLGGGDLLILVFDVSFLFSLRGMAEFISVELEVCPEEIANESILLPSDVGDTLEAAISSECFFKISVANIGEVKNKNKKV